MHFRKKSFAFAATFALFLSIFSATPSQALEQRVIDVVSITWNRAGALPGTITTMKSQIDSVVGPLWKQLTTVYGDPNDKRIEFVSGQTLADPIKLNFAIPCDSNFTTWTSAVRTETYKRLGITDWQTRYLVIMTPNAGCIWSGRALIGSYDKPGGVVALHNSAEGFIVAHELGHTLGLGHSNYMRCSNGNLDGSWKSCSAVEYGGSIDIMGNVDVSTPLSTYHQWRMGLLDKNDIKQSWKNESIEINAVDIYGKPRAVFLRDGTATYWIEYRKAAGSYKSGLVVYRTDPPPGSSIQSPNPADSLGTASMEVGTDIWMLNLDNFSYSASRSSGSMTLQSGTSVSLQSGNISISASPAATDSSIIVNIARKNSEMALKKPILTPTSSWRASDVSVLDYSYTSVVSDIADYEAKINGIVKTLDSSPITDWQPTYLNPFLAPQVLQVKDLPEGQYSLSLRVRDLSGLWSPWSDEVNVNIDRAYPLVGSLYQVEKSNGSVIHVQLSDTRDEGSGLCSTQIINDEGFVTSRSSAKAKPTISLQGSSNQIAQLQVFDCLGNGRAGSINTTSNLTLATSISKTGKWSNASGDFPTGSMKCTGKCTIYMSQKGAVGVVVGAGSVDVTAGTTSIKGFKASKSGDFFNAAGIMVGSKKTVKISGSNFTLIGVAQVELKISDLVNAQNSAPEPDYSLDDPAQKILNKYGFNNGDFSSEWSVFPMGRGTTLEDPVVANKKSMPYLFLSSEVVRYNSVSAASQALSEVKTSYNNCVKNNGGTERDGAFTKYEFLPVPIFTAPLVSESKRVVVHAKIGEGDSVRYLFGVYQYNGDMFTGLYIVRPGSAPFTSAELSRWIDVAGVMAQRLKA
ncbi:MAG: hypothetical protein EBZ85_01185 [Actinobacteria bacterium]|nr:hypothetical protein [Actinomycetota bacterium]